MAKQISMIKFTGKLGEMVGQKDAYGKAIIRQRVESPKNPKTTAQAGQRYKLLPAQRIASALKEIVERGQQGVKYGLESRNLLMKRALKMTQGFPFMEKDDPNTIPGEYQLTKGTLPEIACAFRTENEDFETSLAMSKDYNTSVGDFSEILLQNNAYLQAGDQLTIVVFTRESTDGATIIMSGYKSFILDPESTEEMDNLIIGATFGYGGSNGKMVISNDDKTVVAAAVIVSRANGANGFLRSNATLAVNKSDSAISKYFSNTGRSDALKTYEGDTSISNNTNWPVDVDGDGGSGGSGFVTISADTESESFTIPEGATLRGIGRYAVGDQVTLEYVHQPGEAYKSFENWAINGVSMPALDENPWTFTAQRSMIVGVNGVAVTPP